MQAIKLPFFKPCLLSLIFTLGVFFPQVRAQKASGLLTFEYNYWDQAPMSDLFQTSVYPSQTFAGTSWGAHTLYLRGYLPVLDKSRTKLYSGLQVDWLGIQYEAWPESQDPAARPENLVALSYVLDWQQRLGTRAFLGLQAAPGISFNTGRGLDSDDWIIQGLAYAGMHFKADSSLSGALGLSYTNILGKPRLLPYLQFYWHYKIIELSLELPFEAQASIAIFPRWKIGVEGYVRGNTYNLDFEEDMPGSPFREAQWSTIYGGGMITWHFYKAWQVKLSGGISANRTLELFDGNERLLADFDTEKLEGLYLGLGITHRFAR